jgi:hypothetical protein
MNQTYDPILEVGELRRLRVGAPLRTPAIGTAMVLERAIGEPLVIQHGERVPEARIGNYRRMYLVDTGVHGLSFTVEAPSADPAFPFTVTVNFACQITNPVIIARDNVRDMTAAFSPSLTTIVRSISVGFDLLQSAAAEAAITARLNSAHRQPAVLLTSFVATVEASDVADIVTARRELRVLEIRRDAMRPVAGGGRNEMLAHIMAMDDGDPAALLDREQHEREAHTTASLNALRLLMASDKLEEFNTSRISEQAMSTFFSGDDRLVSKRSGVRDRLERKRRNQLEAGGPVIEEGAAQPQHEKRQRQPAAPEQSDASQGKQADGRRSKRVRGTAWSGDDN